MLSGTTFCETYYPNTILTVLYEITNLSFQMSESKSFGQNKLETAVAPSCPIRESDVAWSGGPPSDQKQSFKKRYKYSK